MKLKSCLIATGFRFLLCVFAASAAFASTIQLNFASLPSSQGWQYDPGTSGCPPSLCPNPNETDVFSVNGSELHMNSVGLNAAPRYVWGGTVDDTLSFDLQFTARVTKQGSPFPYDYLFAVLVGVDNFFVYVGLGPGRVAIEENVISESHVAVDTTQFHSYRLVGYPQAGSYNFFIDGNEVLSRTIGHNPLGSNFIQIGDRIIFDNGQPAGAVADLSSFEFSQVPEPGYSILLAISMLWFLTKRSSIE